MKAEARAMPPLDLAAAAVTDDFRLENYLPYQLSVAAARVSRLLAHRYAAVSGLTIPEWRVLATIARFGTVSPTAVVESTAMDKVKVSRAATALATRGLIRQSADPHDGRGRLLHMTRKGQKVYDRVVPLSREVEASLVEGVGRSQWAALGKALARLNEHVQHVNGDAVV
jgi:DNA-binding MarR family transcriptional regulator